MYVTVFVVFILNCERFFFLIRFSFIYFKFNPSLQHVKKTLNVECSMCCVLFCVCLLRIFFSRFYFVVSLLFYFSFSSSTFSSRTMMMLMLSPNAAKKLNPNGNVETYTHARNHKYNNKIISYFMFFFYFHSYYFALCSF